MDRQRGNQKNGENGLQQKEDRLLRRRPQERNQGMKEATPGTRASTPHQRRFSRRPFRKKTFIDVYFAFQQRLKWIIRARFTLGFTH